jgi:hypothetical protein
MWNHKARRADEEQHKCKHALEQMNKARKDGLHKEITENAGSLGVPRPLCL